MPPQAVEIDIGCTVVDVDNHSQTMVEEVETNRSSLSPRKKMNGLPQQHEYNNTVPTARISSSSTSTDNVVFLPYMNDTTTCCTTDNTPISPNHEHQHEEHPRNSDRSDICHLHRRKHRRRGRSVTFDDTIAIRPVLHRHDMTVTELRNTWMTPSERCQIKNVSTNTVYLMKTGVGRHLTHDDYFCSRGLEHLFDHVSVDCKQEAIQSHKIALAMQRFLRRSGTTNPQMIARAYRKYTLKSRKLAYRKGLDDQQEQEQQQHHYYHHHRMEIRTDSSNEDEEL